jgi:carbonic anhydrase
MKTYQISSIKNYFLDIKAGLNIALVSIFPCIAISKFCNAPSEAGIIAGFAGGIAALASGSRFSVYGPSAGFSAVAIIASQCLANYQDFLTAIVIAGVFQILFSLLRFGKLFDYIPKAVIKGMICGIGSVYIIRHISFVLGKSKMNITDSEFFQSLLSFDLSNFNSSNLGIGILCLISLVFLGYSSVGLRLRKFVPVVLVSAIIGIAINYLMIANPLVSVKPTDLINLEYSNEDKPLYILSKMIHRPSFNIDFEIIKFGFMLSMAISIQGLLSVSAIDKMRPSGKFIFNRELLAHGLGNIISGLLGGIPVVCLLLRSYMNINEGSKTRLSGFLTGFFILASVMFMPDVINMVPFQCVAAMMIFFGFKTFIESGVKKLFKADRRYKIPFIISALVTIIFNVSFGVGCGIIASLLFFIRKNAIKSIKISNFKHYYGDVIKIDLPEDLSFLSTVSLKSTLSKLPYNSKVLIRGKRVEYMDSEIRKEILRFVNLTSKGKNIQVGVIGFKDDFRIEDNTPFNLHSNKNTQDSLTPKQVIKILKEGNDRFINGSSMGHDYKTQIESTSEMQHPLAVIIGCIDSRAISEAIFDLGIGDSFTVRIAGNVINQDIVGSAEFGCGVAGAKVIVILGHTECGAVKAACQGVKLDNLTPLLEKIAVSIPQAGQCSHNKNIVEQTTIENIKNSEKQLLDQSEIIRNLIKNGDLVIQKALYDIKTGIVDFFD